MMIYCVFEPFEFTIQKCVLAKLNMVIWGPPYNIYNDDDDDDDVSFAPRFHGPFTTRMH